MNDGSDGVVVLLLLYQWVAHSQNSSASSVQVYEMERTREDEREKKQAILHSESYILCLCISWARKKLVKRKPPYYINARFTLLSSYKEHAVAVFNTHSPLKLIRYILSTTAERKKLRHTQNIQRVIEDERKRTALTLENYTQRVSLPCMCPMLWFNNIMCLSSTPNGIVCWLWQ